ncbi:uncharacterized protein [Panulirus ornatus]|uniref:uncharacterized protein isoform X5 n=1 Tax=Panulirus ornatus TaxID=150431 RepID=UPI003A865569
MGDGMLSLSWNNHRATFCHILSTLREKERYTDVTLACEGKFYPVHKLVLSTCSEYFESMFEQTPCKHPIIVLKDVKPDELEALLSYMYAGVVNVAQNDLARLIKAAELLQVKGLAVPDEPPQEAETKKTHTPPWSTRDDRTSPHPKRRRRDESGTPQGESHISNSPVSSPRASPYHTESDNHPENSRTPSEGHVSDHRVDKTLERLEQRQEGRSDQKIEHPAKQGSPLQVMLDETLVKEEMVESLDESQNELLDSGMDYGSLNTDSRVENSTAEGGASDHQGQMLPNKYDQSLVPSQPHLPDAVVEALAGPSGMQGWLGGNELGGGFTGVDSYGGEGRHQDMRQTLPSQQPQGHQLVGSGTESQMCGRKSRTGVWQGQDTTFKIRSCPYCSYSTSVATNLRNHMRTHTKEKPFSCSYCSYRSTTKDHLVKHICIHTGEKPYACPYCSYRAVQKGNLKNHILTRHEFGS